MLSPDRPLRQHCRNRHCRQQLPEPVESERRAFCCRGCRESFYLRRCLVCEKPIADERLKTCSRRCRAELRRFPHRYVQAKGVVAKTVKVASEVPVKRAPKAALNGEQPLLAAARRANAAIVARASASAIFQRNVPPLNVIGGFHFANAPAVDLHPRRETPVLAATAFDITDPWTIPSFLRRERAP
jgi:hypothetical protein